jgi:hypothetical protein
VKLVLEDDEDYTDPVDEPGPVAATDEVAGVEAHAKPAPIERFHRSALGGVLAAGMFGLADAIEGRKDDTPAIVVDWAGRQPFEDPIVLRLDPDHPEDSIVMVRPRPKPEADDS